MPVFYTSLNIMLVNDNLSIYKYHRINKKWIFFNQFN